MFIWRSLFSNIRRRALVLAAIPLLSLLSLFTPFFASPTYAITPDEILTKARAWSILSAVIDNASLLDSSISNADADKCAIFGSSDNNAVMVGHHATTNNERVISNVTGASGASWEALEGQVNIANSAMSAVGITGGCRGLLEKLGYTSSGGNMNAPRNYSNGDSEVISRLRSALKPDAFLGRNLGDGSPGDALSYAMLIYLLKNVCGWEYRNPYVANDRSGTPEQSRNNEAQNNGWSGDSKSSHFHTYTFENGKAGENTYYKGAGTEDDVFVGSRTGFAASGNNDAQIDCGDNNGDTVGAKLGDNHRFADAYAALVRPGSDATPGTCGERYPVTGTPEQVARAAALRTACDEGYRNKTPGYCDKFNSDAQAKTACLYGQNTATGGATDVSPPPEDPNNPKEDKTTCALPGIGWILCPVLETMAKVADGIYAFLAEFLRVPPVTNDTGSDLFKIWSTMRNFANIIFVIVFLLIIFSQVTSIGISNYGIKRMLPRLVVGAILVNLSFWICAIAVDLSNIGGSSMKALFDSIGTGFSLPQTEGFFAGFDGSDSGSWQRVVGTLLAGGLGAVALYIGFAALLPILLAVVVTVAATLLALIIRQAAIVILIVISPLAFVAFLLPNTQPLFARWRRLFITMLVLYPIISMLFGAGALAGKIIANG